jgi:hypothetical protein
VQFNRTSETLSSSSFCSILESQIDKYSRFTKLASQQAVVTARIARHDFPNEWPNLLDVLIPIVENSFKMISSAETTHLRINSLYTLHLVMKTLVTKALPAARRLSQMITPNVFRFMSGLLFNQLGLFLEQTGQQDYEKLNETLTIARISLKCLRRLIIHGYQHYSTASEAIETVDALYPYLPKLVKYSGTLQGSHGLHLTLQNMMILIGKVYLDLSSERVVDFVVSPCFLNVIQMYWTLLEAESVETPVLNANFYERIQIQAMKILKNITKHRDFSIVSTKDQNPRLEQALEILNTKLFTHEFIVHVVTILITRYMLLSQEDLEFWEEDPESFVQQEESDHWEYHLRACAEKLFMVLISRNRDIVCPLIMEMMNAIPGMMDSKSLLIKESVYGAVASGSHDLYDFVQFDEWLPMLYQEAQNTAPDFRIVKRRISNVLGKWISVKCSKEKRSLVYEILLSLLQSKDFVVRLTAVQDLRLVVDDFDFEADKFQKYVQPSVDLLLKLMGEVDEYDSKLKIIQCLIVIVERMEGSFVASVVPLVQILPELWTRSEGQNMFRTSIVGIIATLVKTLRSESYQLYPIVFPILSESLDIGKVFFVDVAGPCIPVRGGHGIVDLYFAERCAIDSRAVELCSFCSWNVGIGNRHR